MRKTELANCPQWLLDAYTENEDVDFNEYGILQWRGGDFRGGNFWGGDFRGGNFWGGNFLVGNFWGGDFRGGNFWGGNFRGGNFLVGDFRGGNFWGGNFWGEKITKKPQTIYGLKWVVYITNKQMQIGCQRHTHSEWESFEHSDIKKMDSGAFDFWMTWRTPLLMMCMQHREG